LVLKIFKPLFIMITTKTFLIGSVVVLLAGYLFGWFDDVEKVANMALVLAWVVLYQVIENQTVYNNNLKRMEKRLDEIESKV